MSPLEMLAWQIEWTGGNFAHNLGFIDEDKFNWKPAPTALSALETANHTVEALSQMCSVLENGEYVSDVAPATTREEAQQKIRAAAQRFAQTIRNIKPEEMDEKVQLPWGEQTKAEAAAMDAIEIVHHHGQIAYIQTLLGDTTSHFEMFGT